MQVLKQYCAIFHPQENLDRFARCTGTSRYSARMFDFRCIKLLVNKFEWGSSISCAFSMSIIQYSHSNTVILEQAA